MSKLVMPPQSLAMSSQSKERVAVYLEFFNDAQASQVMAMRPFIHISYLASVTQVMADIIVIQDVSGVVASVQHELLSRKRLASVPACSADQSGPERGHGCCVGLCGLLHEVRCYHWISDQELASVQPEAARATLTLFVYC